MAAKKTAEKRAQVDEQDERPYFASDRLTGSEYLWLIDAIYHIANNGVSEEEFAEDHVESDRDSSQLAAARCLKEIAEVATKLLDDLPLEIKKGLAAQAEAWPVVIRPKANSSAKQAAAKVEALGLGEGLSININHTANSDAGKVPLRESKWPGIGLANHLYTVLLNRRDELGMDASICSQLDPEHICSVDAEDLSAMFSGVVVSPGALRQDDEWQGLQRAKVEEANTKKKTAFWREFHEMLLLATLPELNPRTVHHWSLAGLRYLQVANRGFLVHDIGSDSPAGEKAEARSPLIPARYWRDIKKQAGREGRDARTLLDSRIEKALRKGFRELSKPAGK